MYSRDAAMQPHLLQELLRQKALPTECTPVDAAAAMGSLGMPGHVPLQDCVGCVQNRPDAVARKILRFLETGHDHLVVMLNNALIKAGRFEEGARLAGAPPSAAASNGGDCGLAGNTRSTWDAQFQVASTRCRRLCWRHGMLGRPAWLCMDAKS